MKYPATVGHYILISGYNAGTISQDNVLCVNLFNSLATISTQAEKDQTGHSAQQDTDRLSQYRRSLYPY